MIKSHRVDLEYFTQTKNAQGIVVKAFVPYKTIYANVQPKALNEMQLQAWGINAQNANTKIMFFDTDPAIHESYRAIVEGSTYELRGLNKWPSHSEAILIPLSGVALEDFIVTLDPVAFTGISYTWLDSAYWVDAGMWVD